MTPAVIAALLLAAAPASAEPTPKPGAHKPVVVGPKWETVPDGDQFADHYPVAALGARMEGQATVHCKVHVDGDLFDCQPQDEQPAGWGFGQATVELAPHFKMQPKIVDGVPVEGADVKFTVKWKLPDRGASTMDGPPPPTLAQAQAHDPEAFILARRIADIAGGLDGFSHALQSGYWSLLPRFFGHPDAARTAAFSKSFQGAFDDYSAERRDRFAVVLVFDFSRADLKEIKAFLETPAGAAFARHLPAALASAHRETRVLWTAFIDAWQTRYCAEITCDESDFGGFQKLRDGPWVQTPTPSADMKPAEGAKEDKGG